MTGFAGFPNVSRWKRDPFISMAGRLASSATVGGTRFPAAFGSSVSQARPPNPTSPKLAAVIHFGAAIIASTS